VTERATVVGVIVVSLVVAGCGSDRPTSPSSPASSTLSGTWAGTITDGSAGQGRLELNLSETSLAPGLRLLSGTWRVTFAQAGRSADGVITGGATTTAAVTINLDRAARPTCSPTLLPNAVHADGFVLNVALTANRLAGRSTYYTCTDAFDGTVDLGR
jgi:hypothetical protein